MKNRAVVFLSFLCYFSSTAQENTYDIFYLSIGSAHYENSIEKFTDDHKPFTPVQGARKSARYVAELFERNNNAQGIMLRSEPDFLLSKEDMLQSLMKVIKMAKKSKSKNPLIVFYYCGHGVSEGIAWSQFLVPGDFTEKPLNLDSDPLALDLNLLGEKLLYLGKVTDLMSNAGLPYFCLIDACYEGTREDFSAPLLYHTMNPESIENLKAVSGILRFMNEYKQSDPVVFATPPGTTTETKTDPILTEGVKIGPLCRKLLLIEQQLITTNPLSLLDVVMLLKDPSFDALTSTAITHYQMDTNHFAPLLKK